MNVKCIENLEEIKHLVQKIPYENFSEKLQIFNGSSIGEHIRHIVEFYQCVILNSENCFNYDVRVRDSLIAENCKYCTEKIQELIDKLSVNQENFQVMVHGEFGEINSSYHRELLYTLEHSIHHQAIIKIGLKALNLDTMVSKNFGVATSTLQYRKQCAH